MSNYIIYRVREGEEIEFDWPWTVVPEQLFVEAMEEIKLHIKLDKKILSRDPHAGEYTYKVFELVPLEVN